MAERPLSPDALRVVIPAYNEAANLPALCERISAAAGSRPYELLLVDDGSRDDTAAVAGNLAGRFPILCFTHPVNLGIAAVFLTGLRAALEGAADDAPIAVMEGDGTSDPAVLPRMLEELAAGADVVIASRYHGGAYRNFPLKRWLLSHGANALMRLVCRLPGVSDYTIFYRVYRASVVRRALQAHGDALTSVGGFACNAEMLLRMSPWCRAIREVPFVYDYGVKRGKSSMKISKNLWSYVGLFRVFFGMKESGAGEGNRTLV